ncbi:Hypothetical predicted protein [Marmota monax]|uniref:Rho-GAP domain-containing protein n=1 Tax=Marmota monax TaxID=9995 RepID=A0A5E4CS08_MARMO|nr:Hypothetical predicted protein [Marmota monax]
MKMVSIHSLSELERLKLQETAYHELVARHFLSEFRPDRDVSLKTFGIRLEEVLVNELTRRKHQELTATMQIEEATTGQAAGRRRRGNVVQRMFGRIRRFFSRRRNEPTLPREFTRRGRRGAVSVDSLAELEDGALLLQTLQLSRVSFPIGQRLLGSKRKMSLNPIAKQIPQVVEACCKFIEEHGLKAVGIFTIEYSPLRVRKLREAFDQGLDVVLDDNQNVHDIAALLKEFFRDMKDSLLPDDLYMSFLLTATLKPQDQLSALQLLVYLMPPCHSDTLERLLKALHKITEHCEDSIGLDGQLVPGNRMTSTNLALVFGSALLKKGKFGKRESRKTKLGIDHYVASVNVVRAMIDNWDVLFQVPPHIQRQVAKRVWKSSPEALDFIRRRNLRRIQSARIKMEEDALLSDPVETSAEARAAVLGQSKPFDEGQFPSRGQALPEGQFPAGGQGFPQDQGLPQGQTLAQGQAPAEDHALPEDEYSEEDLSVNEQLAIEYFNQVVFGNNQGFMLPNDLEIEGSYLDDIPELDEEDYDGDDDDDGDDNNNDDDDGDNDDDDTLNFGNLPSLADILGPGEEIPELIEIPDFEEIPNFDPVPEPEGPSHVQVILNPLGNLNPNLEQGPNFENHHNFGLAEVSHLNIIQNSEEILEASEIPGNEEAPDNADVSDKDETTDYDDPSLEEMPAIDEAPCVEKFPEVNGISNPEEFDVEEVPAFAGLPNDEEISRYEEAAESEDPTPEEVQAIHVITALENTIDFDEIQDLEESSDVEECSGDKEDSDIDGNKYSEENPILEGYLPVLSVVPEPENAQIQNETPDCQEDQAFEDDEIDTVTPETEDVSISSSIPDPLPSVAVNLEEVMNVDEVPMPKDVNPKEVQNPKAIPIGSSEEPAVPPGTARSHDDEEGAGNPPIPEQDRPLLRVPREKEAKSGIGYFFP